MIATYLRSSSYSAYDMCQFRYYLEYCLGFKSPSNIKAAMGNVVHKAMELLAKKKLAIQRNEIVVVDDEVTYSLDELNKTNVLTIGFEYYKKVESHHDWSKTELVLCEKWLDKALAYNEGMFNPLNQNIVFVEDYFDHTFEEDWAKYDYRIGNDIISGYLGVKGHIDLCVKHNDHMYEIIDYKTGRKYNWAKGTDKTYNDLVEDFQLRLYHLATSLKYTDVDQILVTIYYINDGGPVTVMFEKDDLLKTKNMIVDRFRQMKKVGVPKRIWGDWKCKKLCHYGKSKLRESDSLCTCEQISKEIGQSGIDAVNARYIKLNVLTEYGSGGGTSKVNDSSSV